MIQRNIIIYIICLITTSAILFKIEQRQYYQTMSGFEFTIWGDYMILGERYTSLLLPPKNYLKIKKFYESNVSITFLSDDRLVIWCATTDTLTSKMTDYHIEHIYKGWLERYDYDEHIISYVPPLSISLKNIDGVYSPIIYEVRDTSRICTTYFPKYMLVGCPFMRSNQIVYPIEEFVEYGQKWLGVKQSNNDTY